MDTEPRTGCDAYKREYAAALAGENYQAKLSETAPVGACTGIGLADGCSNDAFISRIGQLSGIAGLNIACISNVSDVLIVRDAHMAPLPGWANHNQTAAVFDHIVALHAWAAYARFYSASMRRLTGGMVCPDIASALMTFRQLPQGRHQ